MPTVQQVARELGLTSQEVIARLRSMGERVDGHLSPVEDSVAARLRRDNGASVASASDRAAEPTLGEEAEAAPQRPSSKEPTPATEATAADGGKVAAKKSREKPASKRRSLAARATELPLLMALALGIAILLKLFVVQAFFIPSGSMIPTLVQGDRVLVEKLSYRFSDPDAGDVVVFEWSATGQTPDLPWYEDAKNFARELLGLPSGETQDYIKRVVAVGGDVIRYEDRPRSLTVNGSKVEEDYLERVDKLSPTITPDTCRSMEMEANEGGCRVPAGTIFVMGDNRGDSQDSRFIGPLDLDKVVGRAFVVIWPPGNLSGL